MSLYNIDEICGECRHADKCERAFDDYPETELALWVVMLIGMGLGMGLVILGISPIQP